MMTITMFFLLVSNGPQHLEFIATRVSRDDPPMGAILKIDSLSINL